MTYCVAMQLKHGLIFMSDTRTNAGVDNVSSFKKMFTWSEPGERFITLLTAGNLATTQSVVSLLEERLVAPKDRNPSILACATMFQVAMLIGETLREVIRQQVGEDGPEAKKSPFSATLIVGGQIGDMPPRLFMIYPEGNFIEAGTETPFFQIGETKYGRPIILRAYDPEMSYEEAVKLLCVSFDSTLKANLGVGMPLDLLTYDRDSLRAGRSRRFEVDDPYFTTISRSWGDALKSAFNQLPGFSFDN